MAHPAGKVGGFGGQADSQARKSANILMNILESTTDSIFVKDTSLRLVLCNAVLARAVGKRPEETYGKTDVENGWSPSLVKGDPARGIRGWEQDDRDALSGTTIRARREPSNVDGKIRYFDTVKMPLRNDEGVIVGMLGIGRDVTDQVMAEESLRKSREELAQERELLLTLINSLPDLVYVKDHDGRFILANEATASFMGAGGPSGLTGKTDHDFYPRQEADRFRQDERGILDEGRAIINQDEPNLSADGVLRWILTTKVPFRDESGKVAGLVGIGRDITDRKLVEQKLKEQAALLDSATDAILVRDMDNRIVYWNKGAEKVYEWSADEILGKDVDDLLGTRSSDLEEARRKVLADGQWSGEFHRKSRGGRSLLISARWTLVRDEAGRPKGILAVNTDVTEHAAIQTQLRRAQRLESLGTLAGGIAHDLNNVLLPILMGVEALRLRHNDADTRKTLDIVSAAAQRGAGIVRQVLSFARGIEGDRAEVQLRHIVGEIEQIVRETFPKNMEIASDLPRDLPLVMGDATQLRQVLMNLCLNSRDAMPEGGRLTLSAEEVRLDESHARLHFEARPISYVVLEVRDTGAGMAPAIVEKIFDPFFTTKRQGRGAGLGLSTARSIVKSHGGFISVHSEPSRGSSFKVYIPSVEQGQEKRGEKVPEGIPMGEGELVLVVDDEAAIRDIAKQILESYGYRVLTAGDGTEALALFAQRKADIRVIITDMIMPYMDGAATVRALRKIDPSVRIIASSGFSAGAQGKDAAAPGTDGFLVKPYTSETLLETLRTVLSAGRKTRPT